MWLLPELPPHQREDDEMIPRPWEYPAMVTPIQDPSNSARPTSRTNLGRGRHRSEIQCRALLAGPRF
jgi:hypothetical protein